MTIDINNYKETEYYKNLSPTLKRVADLTVQCCWAVQLQREAEIEGRQRGFFESNSAGSADTVSVPDEEESADFQQTVVARVRKAAGHKAAETRRANEAKVRVTKKSAKTFAKKLMKKAKKTRGAVANYERPAILAGDEWRSGPRKRWSDEEIRSTILRIVTDEPDKHSAHSLHKLITCRTEHLYRAIKHLEQEGKIRGGLRKNWSSV